ncbi:uncharacterized protein LOC110743950 [Papio anubis]|uniref:uncharacterized protein LOC110743950 n=1 Tax=Papio anubis TaxID=9555 RepID=UPI0012ADDE52|nr:uncharacterized protein LOC110743950 [Papio anubis]
MEPGLLLDSFQGRWASSSLLTRGFDAPALGCLVPAPKSSERSQGLETVSSGSDALRGLWILGLVSVPGPVFSTQGGVPCPALGRRRASSGQGSAIRGLWQQLPGTFRFPQRREVFLGEGRTLWLEKPCSEHPATRSTAAPGGSPEPRKFGKDRIMAMKSQL